MPRRKHRNEINITKCAHIETTIVKQNFEKLKVDKQIQTNQILKKAETSKSNDNEIDPRNVIFLGCWIHLNHFLNCRIETCKFYATVRMHLRERNQINAYDIILVPIERKLTNYWEGLYSIICSNFMKCHTCLKLVFHLSANSIACHCNSYEISDIQDSVAKLIEMYPVAGRPFNTRENAILELLYKEIIDNLAHFRLTPTITESLFKKDLMTVKKKGLSLVANCPKGDTNELRQLQRSHMSLGASSKHKNEHLCTFDSEKQSVKINDDQKAKRIEFWKQKIMNGGVEVVSNGKSVILDSNTPCNHPKDFEYLMSNYKKWKQFQSTAGCEKKLKLQSCTVVGFKCYFCELKIRLSNCMKYEGVLIPDFCVKERNQTTCNLTWEDERYVPVLRQYCLSVHNLFIEPMQLNTQINKEYEFRFADCLHPDLVHVGSASNKYISMSLLKDVGRITSNNWKNVTTVSRISKVENTSGKICDFCIKKKNLISKNSCMETSNF